MGANGTFIELGENILVIFTGVRTGSLLFNACISTIAIIIL